MDSYVWRIPQEDKQHLFETATDRYDTKSGLAEDLSVNRSWLYRQLAGEFKTVGVVAASKLLDVISDEPDDAGHSDENAVTGAILPSSYHRCNNIEEATRISEASEEDVRKAADIVDTLQYWHEDGDTHERRKLGFLEAHTGLIEDLINDDGQWVTPDGRGEGQCLSVIEQFGLVEQFGSSGSAYEITARPGLLHILHEQVEKYRETEPVRYTDEELIEAIQLEYDDVGKPLSFRYVQDQDHLPDGNTYADRFGSWNNALWRAGIPPANETYEADEVADIVRRKYHELGRAPHLAEMDEDTRFPSNYVFNKHGFSDLVEDAGKLIHDESYSGDDRYRADAA